MQGTLGEQRVRVDFNVSGETVVDHIKRVTAEIIDTCEDLNPSRGDEVKRLIALAQTAYEQAAMWAVKAATA